jgi:hypothetical protein
MTLQAIVESRPEIFKQSYEKVGFFPPTHLSLVHQEIESQVKEPFP